MTNFALYMHRVSSAHKLQNLLHLTQKHFRKWTLRSLTVAVNCDTLREKLKYVFMSLRFSVNKFIILRHRLREHKLKAYRKLISEMQQEEVHRDRKSLWPRSPRCDDDDVYRRTWCGHFLESTNGALHS